MGCKILYSSILRLRGGVDCAGDQKIASKVLPVSEKVGSVP